MVNRYTYTLIIFILFYSVAVADSGMIINSFGNFGEGSTPETKYVGWANTAGVPDSNPADSGALTADATFVNKWTATENGTVQQINMYIGSSWSPDNFYLCVYRGTTLIGFVDISGESISTNAWTGYFTVNVVGGQSLDFSTSDDMYFGFALNEEGAETTRFGRTTTGEASPTYYFDTSTAVSGTSPATTVTWGSSTRILGSIMKYVTR